MSDNPRQFSSLDAGDRGFGGSLTNRPASGLPSISPIDFGEHIAVSNAVIRAQKQKGTYTPRTSEAETAYQAELKAASDAAFRESAQKGKAEQELQAQRTQARNLELQRIRSSDNTPHPYEIESERATQRRLMGLPPVDEPPSTSAATASRQPTPSTGSPPPTPNGTAVRASSLVEPTATPAPAALKEAIGGAVGSIASALPRSLPQAAGRLVIPGVGGALVLGGRLIAGQSLTQAAAGTAGTLIGSGVGVLVGTAIAGPIGGVVGSMIGGFAGGLFSDWLFAQNLPKGTAHLETFIPNYPPFRGGQVQGIKYRVQGTVDVYLGGDYFRTNYVDMTLYGAVESVQLVTSDPTNLEGLGWKINAYEQTRDGFIPKVYYASVGHPNGATAKPNGLLITRVGGRDEYEPDVLQPTPPPINYPPQYNQPSPIGNDNTVPSGTPSAGVNKGKTREIAPSMPSNNTPNSGGAFPGHGGLAPSFLPNPTQTPSNGGGMLPDYAAPQPQPMPFLEPQDTPAAREANRNGLTVTPSTGGIVPVGYADISPATITQSTVTRSEGTDALGNYIAPGTQVPASSFSTPTSTPQLKKASPTPDAYSPVPKMQLQPQPKTTEQVTADKTSEIIKQQKKDFDDQIGRLTAIATAIAALTPAINGIPDAIAKSPAVQAANKGTTKEAVCDISQPGGCLGAPIKKAEDAAKANGNKLNDILTGLNTAGSAAQLALLETINGKLGDQLPGGIGGKLSRFADWMHLDRVLNILIIATTIHNGLMLSNDIGQTLLGIINNALSLVGLKKEDGTAFDISSVISGSIENLIKAAIGSENYQELSKAWQKANRVYQSATNVLNNLMNVNSVITNALEVIGSYTGKIGNALRIWGVLGEKAYSWMNPQPSFDNKWITKLQQLQQNASTVAMVAQIPVDAVNAVTELNNSATEFVKAVQQEPDTKPGIDVGEAAKVKTEREAAKTASYVPAFDISDLFDADD